MTSSHGLRGRSCLQARREVLQTPTDDDRRQRPLLVWSPTLCVGGPVITDCRHYQQLECWQLTCQFPTCRSPVLCSFDRDNSMYEQQT